MAIKSNKDRGKKKPFYELFQGADFRADNGRWIQKIRLFDRRNDRYVEHVVDEETGEVYRDVDEPLSSHLGHGSDKPANLNPPSLAPNTASDD